MPEDVIYIYCVTEGIKPKAQRGIYRISYKGLYSVVSKVPYTEFSEDALRTKMSDLNWIKDRILRHETVVEDVMSFSTTVPFKFATIFRTENNVKAMMKERYEEFKEILKRLKGKEEWSVKVYSDPACLRNLLKKDSEITSIEREIASSAEGKAYLLKKKKAEIVESAMNKKVCECADLTFKELKGLSVDAYILRLLTKEVTKRQDEMILNAAFLVEKSRLRDFIKGADYLTKKHRDAGLKFCLGGPWPPYNFCEIRGKLWTMPS